MMVAMTIKRNGWGADFEGGSAGPMEVMGEKSLTPEVQTFPKALSH